MKKILIILTFIYIGIVFFNKQEKKEVISKKIEFTEVIEKDYQLYKPNKDIKAVLILFGGYLESAEDIKREFKILDIARENNVAVLLTSYNQKLWLEQNEKQELARTLQDLIVKNKLPNDNIFIGGFSSGGVVSILISDFIIRMKQFYINPKGVFIVDSPIDLVGLYKNSKKNIEQSFSETSIKESTWLLENLNNNFGNPKDNIDSYERYSVFTYSTNNTSNFKKLKRTKIRFYTEPDTLWWKKNRKIDYEQMNAFYIKKLYDNLIRKGYENVEYISTINKGYRSSGEKHPHSWSIVDKVGLINWMLDK